MRNAFRIPGGKCFLLASEPNVVLGRSRGELPAGTDPSKPSTVFHIRTRFYEQLSRPDRVRQDLAQRQVGEAPCVVVDPGRGFRANRGSFFGLCVRPLARGR